MKLFVLLIFFSTNVYSASFLASQHPFYFFLQGNETLMCRSDNANVSCLAKDNDTGIVVKYNCKKVTPKQGYLKDCRTKNTINRSEDFFLIHCPHILKRR